MRMMRFKPKAEDVPGKKLAVADTLFELSLASFPEISESEDDIKANDNAAEMSRPTVSSKTGADQASHNV